jgi:hypothetical protein
MRNYSGLTPLPEFSIQVYASPGVEPEARRMGARCQRACDFLSAVLKAQAEVSLLVLEPQHWEEYTGSPMYGVPQTVDLQTIVVSGQNSELWRMVVPPPESLSPTALESLQAVYSGPEGYIDIAPFMQLLPVHELGHLFIDQSTGQFDTHFSRRWLVELWCNLALHAYIVSEEPQLDKELETFPNVIVSLGSTHLSHQALSDFEWLYADMEPPNFVWYQCQLHHAAKRIYEAGGLRVLQDLFQFIVQPTDPVSDEELAPLLRNRVHPEVEAVLTRWPEFFQP